MKKTVLLYFLIIVLNLNAHVKEPIRTGACTLYTNTCIGTDKETRYYRNSFAEPRSKISRN